jgi:heptosyltransferase-1
MRYISPVRSQAGARNLPLSGTTEPQRILILRFSALGDVIQTLPLASWLRLRYPNAVIGWAIDEELAGAIEGHTALDHVHRIGRKRWSRSLKHPGKWLSVRQEFSAFINEIKDVGYDLAIDPQSLFKTSVIAFSAGIKRRVGYGHGREMSGLFLNERHLGRDEYFDPNVLHMKHLVQLAQAVGCRETALDIEAPPTPPAIAGKIDELIAGGFATRKPIVAIAPGTQWDSKLWPEASWIKLIENILNDMDMNVLLVGSKGDAPLCRRLTEGAKVPAGRLCDISGQTNIREMYAVYKHTIAAIGPDSAPQHIAGAVKTPCVICIFGPTAFKRTAPVGSPVVQLLSAPVQLECQPCHKSECRFATNECMGLVTPDMVLDSLKQGLSQTAVTYAHR